MRHFGRATLILLYEFVNLFFHQGPPVVPFYPFLAEGSPTKIDYRKKGTLIPTSLLEDLVYEFVNPVFFTNCCLLFFSSALEHPLLKIMKYR